MLNFLAKEAMVGIEAFILGATYCFIRPLFLFLKSENNKTTWPKKISLILLPVFIALSWINGTQKQAVADKYYEEHLIEMMKIKSVKLNFTTTESLIAISDEAERQKYIPEIKKLAEDADSFCQDNAKRILEAWGVSEIDK